MEFDFLNFQPLSQKLLTQFFDLKYVFFKSLVNFFFNSISSIQAPKN
ncbi:hypothetical protein HPHPP4D_1486 [Helicobacter pylori Hp P-4d]|uniref:Uncharacterized protein n=1 Tax=Helicobacter pylori Hp P-4 TaxID=992075 RepID=I9WB98_HELPX|nr:hypothetical protein HPHPP4_1273 [Helicobacter pylori Hp P-4]EJC22392.1 hypothetical protein HPHPP4D_1486 [Helicobacter pylori Hp P-4d]EJC23103.1 hypothetical protein HPHPP4C_1296 [Helicobacter pylori Hp P-4c]